LSSVGLCFLRRLQKSFYMELVAVDTPGVQPKNWRMTDAERERIGRKLRAMRIERGLDQIPAAEKAGLSVGTLQAIENNRKRHPVKDGNIERYAQSFGTTIRRLLKADEIAPTDPRLDDLNEEHLEVARSYMRARRDVRHGVEVLLSHPASDNALAQLLVKVCTLPPERVSELARLLTVAPDLFPVITELWQQFHVDPNYVALMKEGLLVRDRHPIPTAPQKHGAKPHRRA